MGEVEDNEDEKFLGKMRKKRRRIIELMVGRCETTSYLCSC